MRQRWPALTKQVQVRTDAGTGERHGMLRTSTGLHSGGAVAGGENKGRDTEGTGKVLQASGLSALHNTTELRTKTARTGTHAGRRQTEGRDTQTVHGSVGRREAVRRIWLLKRGGRARMER